MIKVPWFHYSFCGYVSKEDNVSSIVFILDNCRSLGSTTCEMVHISTKQFSIRYHFVLINLNLENREQTTLVVLLQVIVKYVQPDTGTMSARTFTFRSSHSFVSFSLGSNHYALLCINIQQCLTMTF